MASLIDYLKAVLMVQLFYAFCITLLVYALPTASLDDITQFREPADQYSREYIATELESNIGNQFNLPEIELATLVFYSGNIFLDLMLNFAAAVPQMFGLLIGAFLLFFNLDATISTQLILFFEVLIGMLYLISVIAFLMSMRTQGAIV